MRVRIEGDGEACLNLCTQLNLRFSDVRRLDAYTVEMSMQYPNYRKLHALHDGRFSLKIVRGWGTPFLLRRIKRRWGLFAGGLFCLVIVWCSSFYIWELEVSGNETVSQGEILRALDELGVEIGTNRLLVNQEYLSNEMLQKIPELSWFALNISGSRAVAQVQECEAEPKMLDALLPTSVYAEKSGVLTKVTVLNGTGLFKVGDAVSEGEILVSGRMDSLSTGARYVHSIAEIYAETQYDLEAEIPLETVTKSYTGANREKYALILGDARLNLCFMGRNQTGSYDKITTINKLRLWDGTALPIGLVKETYQAYEPICAAVDPEAAEKLLQERLAQQLEREIGEGGEIRSASFHALTEEGLLRVQMHAVCVEEIGVEREMTTKELAEAKQENQTKEE